MIAKTKRMKISYATISKTGKRMNNEDAFCVIDEQEEGRWFGIVCDGMGGHAMGEVASEGGRCRRGIRVMLGLPSSRLG